MKNTIDITLTIPFAFRTTRNTYALERNANQNCPDEAGYAYIHLGEYATLDELVVNADLQGLDISHLIVNNESPYVVGALS